MTGKTLKELNVKSGDVVKYIPSDGKFTVESKGNLFSHQLKTTVGYSYGWNNVSNFEIVSRAEPYYKAWGEMTSEEKGALLLAKHEDKPLQYKHIYSGGWQDLIFFTKFHDETCYRTKKVETVVLKTYVTDDGKSAIAVKDLSNPTHKITFKTVDGEPDVTSIKMEKL